MNRLFYFVMGISLTALASCATHINVAIHVPEPGDIIVNQPQPQVLFFGLKATNTEVPKIQHANLCPKYTLPKTPAFTPIPVDRLREAASNKDEQMHQAIMLDYLSTVKKEQASYFTKLNRSYGEYIRNCQ